MPAGDVDPTTAGLLQQALEAAGRREAELAAEIAVLAAAAGEEAITDIVGQQETTAPVAATLQSDSLQSGSLHQAQAPAADQALSPAAAGQDVRHLETMELSDRGDPGQTTGVAALEGADFVDLGRQAVPSLEVSQAQPAAARLGRVDRIATLDIRQGPAVDHGFAAERHNDLPADRIAVTMRPPVPPASPAERDLTARFEQPLEITIGREAPSSAEVQSGAPAARQGVPSGSPSTGPGRDPATDPLLEQQRRRRALAAFRSPSSARGGAEQGPEDRSTARTRYSAAASDPLGTDPLGADASGAGALDLSGRDLVEAAHEGASKRAIAQELARRGIAGERVAYVLGPVVHYDNNWARRALRELGDLDGWKRRILAERVAVVLAETETLRADKRLPETPWVTPSELVVAVRPYSYEHHLHPVLQTLVGAATIYSEAGDPFERGPGESEAEARERVALAYTGGRVSDIDPYWKNPDVAATRDRLASAIRSAVVERAVPLERASELRSDDIVGIPLAQALGSGPPPMALDTTTSTARRRRARALYGYERRMRSGPASVMSWAQTFMQAARDLVRTARSATDTQVPRAADYRALIARTATDIAPTVDTAGDVVRKSLEGPVDALDLIDLVLAAVSDGAPLSAAVGTLRNPEPAAGPDPGSAAPDDAVPDLVAATGDIGFIPADRDDGRSVGEQPMETSMPPWLPAKKPAIAETEIPEVTIDRATSERRRPAGGVDGGGDVEEDDPTMIDRAPEDEGEEPDADDHRMIDGAPPEGLTGDERARLAQEILNDLIGPSRSGPVAGTAGPSSPAPARDLASWEPPDAPVAPTSEPPVAMLPEAGNDDPAERSLHPPAQAGSLPAVSLPDVDDDGTDGDTTSSSDRPFAGSGAVLPPTTADPPASPHWMALGRPRTVVQQPETGPGPTPAWGLTAFAGHLLQQERRRLQTSCDGGERPGQIGGKLARLQGGAAGSRGPRSRVVGVERGRNPAIEMHAGRQHVARLDPSRERRLGVDRCELGFRCLQPVDRPAFGCGARGVDAPGPVPADMAERDRVAAGGGKRKRRRRRGAQAEIVATRRRCKIEPGSGRPFTLGDRQREPERVAHRPIRIVRHCCLGPLEGPGGQCRVPGVRAGFLDGDRGCPEIPRDESGRTLSRPDRREAPLDRRNQIAGTRGDRCPLPGRDPGGDVGQDLECLLKLPRGFELLDLLPGRGRRTPRAARAIVDGRLRCRGILRSVQNLLLGVEQGRRRFQRPGDGRRRKLEGRFECERLGSEMKCRTGHDPVEQAGGGDGIVPREAVETGGHGIEGDGRPASRRRSPCRQNLAESERREPARYGQGQMRIGRGNIPRRAPPRLPGIAERLTVAGPDRGPSDCGEGNLGRRRLRRVEFS